MPKPSEDTRKKKFLALMSKWPEPGDEIMSLYEDGVVLNYDKPRNSLYTTAIVDEAATGWYLEFRPYGVRCVLDRKQLKSTLQEFMRAKHLGQEYRIPGLRVVRVSNQQTCLVCELL